MIQKRKPRPSTEYSFQLEVHQHNLKKSQQLSVHADVNKLCESSYINLKVALSLLMFLNTVTNRFLQCSG